jgi:photosystem II stability/assembly factor-like uncharacterized protein
MGLVNSRMGHQGRHKAAALALSVSVVLAAACTGPARTATPRTTPTATAQATLFPPTPTPLVPVAPAPTPVPQLPIGSVPVGFVPQSVTFVSLSMGWVLGSAPCKPTTCLVLLETTDSGRTWTSRPVPPTNPATIGYASAGSGVGAVRFADAEDGWLFGPDLWSTHDGGVHWARQPLPGDPTMTMVEALETARGVVHAVLYDFAAIPGVKIESSPTGRDAWVRSKVSIELGAGPVAHAQLVIQGSGGWIVENDRGVVGGARLVNGAWRPWRPPCDPVNDGSATLAAATANDLVALCNDSFLGPPGIRLYASRDGGSTFLRSTPSLPPSGDYTSVATPRAGTLVTNGSNADGTLALLESLDSGTTWTTVYSDGDATPADMGFTSPLQGAAVESSMQTSGFIMTFDGGRHWNPVIFRSAI